MSLAIIVYIREIKRLRKAERIGDDGRTHAQAVEEILEAVREHDPEVVGHRVVHGGDRF